MEEAWVEANGNGSGVSSTMTPAVEAARPDAGEVENGFVMIDGERPEDDLPIHPVIPGNLSADPMEADSPITEFGDLAGKTRSTDLNLAPPMEVAEDGPCVDEETARLCNLSIDE